MTRLLSIAACLLLLAGAISYAATPPEVDEAIRDGNLDRVLELMKAHQGVALTADDAGWTPLHWAAAFGQQAIAETLLANGADANARDEQGVTPLYLAAAGEHAEVVELLGFFGATKLAGSLNSVPPPVLVSDTTALAPLRYLAEWLGATTAFQAATGDVTLSIRNRVVTVTLGKTDALLDGNVALLDAAPLVRDGVTYVPLKFVAEAFGATVTADPGGQAYTVTAGERTTRLPVAAAADGDAVFQAWKKFRQAVEKNDIPGMAAMLCKGGRITFITTNAADERQRAVHEASYAPVVQQLKANQGEAPAAFAALREAMKRAASVQRSSIAEWVLPSDRTAPIWQWTHVWFEKENGQWLVRGLQVNVSATPTP